MRLVSREAARIVGAMLVRFSKLPAGAAADTLTCVRPDGTSTTAAMTRQGVLPHEAIHFVVENSLRWHDAFFGVVARGSTLAEATAKLHGARIEWAKLTQGLQTEALVECLQAEQWAGASDPAAFAEKLVTTCRRHGVAPPEITADEVDGLRLALREFGAAWRPLASGAALERTFGS